MMLVLALVAQTADFSWIAGTWCTEPKNGSVTCDNWVPIEKGGMRGTNITRREGRVVTNETMAITIDQAGAVFHAEPVNQPPGDFRAVKNDTEGRSVTFEGAEHDYPQRVRYWREGDTLMAEISLLDGSKAVRWQFHRER